MADRDLIKKIQVRGKDYGIHADYADFAYSLEEGATASGLTLSDLMFKDWLFSESDDGNLSLRWIGTTS